MKKLFCILVVILMLCTCLTSCAMSAQELEEAVSGSIFVNRDGMENYYCVLVFYQDNTVHFGFINKYTGDTNTDYSSTWSIEEGSLFSDATLKIGNAVWTYDEESNTITNEDGSTTYTRDDEFKVSLK